MDDSQLEQVIKGGYVLGELEQLQKLDDPQKIHDTLQAWADGPDGLRKTVATSFMDKAHKAAAEKPGSAVRRWSKPGAVAQGAGAVASKMGEAQAAQAAHHKEMDGHARRFAHAVRHAAVWGASLGAAAAGGQNRGLAPRNPLTGAPAAAAGAGGGAAGMAPAMRSCPTCGQPMPMRKAFMGGNMGLAPKDALTGAAVPATGACPTCGQPMPGAMRKADGADVLEEPLEKGVGGLAVGGYLGAKYGSRAGAALGRSAHRLFKPGSSASNLAGRDVAGRVGAAVGGAAGAVAGAVKGSRIENGETKWRTRARKRGQHGMFSKGDGLEKVTTKPQRSPDPTIPDDHTLVPTQEPTNRAAKSALSDLPTSRKLAMPKPGPGFTPHNAETGALTKPTRGKPLVAASEDATIPDDHTLVPTQEPTNRDTDSQITKGPPAHKLASPKPGPGFTPRNAMTGRLSGKQNARKPWTMSRKAQV